MVQRAMESLPVVVVTGMRQTGKTTMLLNDHAFAERTYRCLEEYAYLEAAKNAPEDFLGNEESHTIDEVQLVPELLSAIKVKVDRSRRPGRFVLSGSSNLLLQSKVTESLAGRALFMELMPMTRRELRQETTRTPFVVSWMESPPRSVHEEAMLLTPEECLLGGMPPVAVDGADKGIWFQGFEQTYLERDVRQLAQVADLAVFRTFFRSAALRPGGILNLTELARDVGITQDTARRYIGVLETSYSLVRLPAWRRGATARLVKSPKMYLADSGLAAWLNGFGDLPDPLQHRSWGAILETYVLQNLRAILGAWVPDAHLYYWREQGRHEVDFIVEHHNSLLAVELKWTSRWTPADLAGLRRFRELYPSCRTGLLVCRVDRITPLGDGLFAIPIGTFLS